MRRRQSIAATFAWLALAASASTALAQACPGDIDGNGSIDAVDLGLLLSQWGGPGSARGGADLDGDGVVGATDLAGLLGGWGPCAIVPAWASLLEVYPDPAVVTDAAIRAAIRATGFAWRVRDTASQVEMVLVPPRIFAMGCSASLAAPCVADESPVHEVGFANPLYVGRFEITQGQWTAVVGANPSFFQGAAYPDSAERPVEKVSWHQLGQFLAPTGTRLLTEAEWEHACRGGTTTAFHGTPTLAGGTDDDAQLGLIAWFSGNNGASGTPGFGTKRVGLKPPNGFGLHDMSGNVREWVADFYGVAYYAESAVWDPIGPPKGTDRVLRGGGWIDPAGICRSSDRFYFPPVTTGSAFTGFRVAKEP